jgi:hypothetical protein
MGVNLVFLLLGSFSWSESRSRLRLFNFAFPEIRIYFALPEIRIYFAFPEKRKEKAKSSITMELPRFFWDGKVYFQMVTVTVQKLRPKGIRYVIPTRGKESKLQFVTLFNHAFAILMVEKIICTCIHTYLHTHIACYEYDTHTSKRSGASWPGNSISHHPGLKVIRNHALKLHTD